MSGLKSANCVSLDDSCSFALC